MTGACWCADRPRVADSCVCGDDAGFWLASVRLAFPSEAAANRWLNSFDRRLGSVPLDAIRAGRGSLVAREARRQATA